MAHSGAADIGPDTAPDLRSGRVELAVGLATRNQGETIGPLVQGILRGLASAFPDRRTVLIHADAGSQDGTVERVREAAGTGAGGGLSQVRFDSVLPRPGISGVLDPAGLRGILEEARRLGAVCCAVVDAQVRSMPAGWIERLAGPLVAGQLDFVAPYYLRHPFDGTLTSGIAYPLQRALYGKQVRYPLPTDFACSARFIEAVLGGRAWPAELSRVGAEAWLLTRALVGDFRIGQAFLGVKDAAGGEGAAGSEVAEVLPRVLGGLFLETERHAAVWQKIRRSGPVPVMGAPAPGSPEPRPLDPLRALEGFRLGERNLQDVWKLVLSPAALLELARLARGPDEGFRFPDGVWARAVYDFALAHRLRVMSRDHLLAAFTPLYLGWLAGFALELGAADPVRAEARIEELCLRFEAEKPYLISRWRWPDRFNP